MIRLAVISALPRLFSRLVPGQRLHRRGLAAAARKRYGDADRWFEAAAAAYRRELAVEALARVRVHQAMARARSNGGASGDTETLLEIVRGLNRLDALESFEPPHALIDAREVLAEWVAAGEAGARTPVEAGAEPARAAA